MNELEGVLVRRPRATAWAITAVRRLQRAFSKPALTAGPLLGIVFALGVTAASAEPEPGERPASIPGGWADLCRREPSFCSHYNRVAVPPALTSERRAELEAVNRAVNQAVAYATDRTALGVEEFWSLPIAGKGDCEDYALEKRRRLMELGWPRSALLMTVVIAHNGDWHALLTVETDAGMLVLDNMTDAVLPPKETRHRFFSSQSRQHPDKWVMWVDRALVARNDRRREAIPGSTAPGDEPR